jgi:AraC family transcriptional regulator, arabinose operon regulatory protein
MVYTYIPQVAKLLTGYSHHVQGYRVLRARSGADWLLKYTLAGHARFGYNGGDIITKRGDVVLLEPHSLHDYGIAPSSQYLKLHWVHFHPRSTWTQWLNLPEVAPGIRYLQVEPAARKKIEECFKKANHLARGNERQRDEFAMNALEEILLLLDAINPRVQPQLDARIAKARNYLQQNFREPIKLPELAESCHLSVSRFAHLFREQLGVSPMMFLELERLEQAKKLLSFTSKSVQVIAEEVGFTDPFYFTRRLKRHTGMSPRALREKNV